MVSLRNLTPNLLFLLSLIPSAFVMGEDENPLSSQEIFINLFETDSAPSGLLMDENGRNLSLVTDSLSNVVNQILKEKINRDDILINVLPQKNKRFNLSDVNSTETIKIKFSKEGIPLCLFEVKAMNLGGTLNIFGNVPDLSSLEEDLGPLPDLQPAVELSLKEIKSNPDEQSILKKSLCLFSSNSTLKPVWDLILKSQGLKYEVWSDESTVYKVSKRFFDLKAAQVGAYDRDPVTNSSTTVFDLETIDETLTSEIFTTDTTPDESGIQRARSSTYNFVYPTDDDRFKETSIFAHASRQYSFFKSIGFDSSDDVGNQIILKIHSLIGGTKNNAMYQPGESEGEHPIIMIGDGDNLILKNLNLDSDVVSHELGHHVIFKNITETSGQSLILHEGLADYFVFAKNADPCLGRSICVPGGSDSACVIPRQCLRVGSTTLQYNSKTYNSYEAHYKSQLVSGFLYSLNSVFDSSVTPKVTLHALELLVGDSGLKHLVISLMLADYQMNNGTSACKIYDAAVSRGLSSLLSGVDCTKIDSLKLMSSSGETVKSTPKKGIFGCSNKNFKIGSAAHFDIDIGLLTFFLFPFFRRRKKID